MAVDSTTTIDSTTADSATMTVDPTAEAPVPDAVAKDSTRTSASAATR